MASSKFGQRLLFKYFKTFKQFSHWGRTIRKLIGGGGGGGAKYKKKFRARENYMKKKIMHAILILKNIHLMSSCRQPLN